MFYEVLLFSSGVIFVVQNVAGDLNSSTVYELALSKVETRLNLASRTLENAKRDLRNADTNSSTEYELTISKVETRLNLASRMLETSKRELRNDLNQICNNSSCNLTSTRCSNLRCHPGSKPVDCSDIYHAGYRSSGVYDIWPKSRLSRGPLPVYCDMEDGGGWTVVLRRGTYGNSVTYFSLGWNEYKTGFGHLLREFWIGNDNLFSLTNQRSYQLKIVSSFGSASHDFLYEDFWVDDEVQNYTLHVTTGDVLYFSNGKKFSTKDRDDNFIWGNCAEKCGCGWWHNYCLECNFAQHNQGFQDTSPGKWTVLTAQNPYLKDALMKIRPSGFTSTS